MCVIIYTHPQQSVVHLHHRLMVTSIPIQTIKSLRVIVVCHEGNSVKSEGRLQLHIAECHLNGTWQPNPSDLCDLIASDETPSSPGKSV